MQTTVLMCVIGAIFGGTMGIAHSSMDDAVDVKISPRLVSTFSRFDAQFDAVDADGDGVLTRLEIARAGMSGLAGKFDHIDANHDGSITREELLTLIHPRISTSSIRDASRVQRFGGIFVSSGSKAFAGKGSHLFNLS